MNYMVLCVNEKEAYNCFYETAKNLTPIKVNMTRKKIIFCGDVYSFVSQDFFKRYLKKDFLGETISASYFIEKWVM